MLIWGGLISPLLILYATTHQVGLSGPILVTTVVGLAIFLIAVLVPGDERQGIRRRPDRRLKLPSWWHGIACRLPPFSRSRTHSWRFCVNTSSTAMPSAAPIRAKE
jgi:hypothetical protein